MVIDWLNIGYIAETDRLHVCWLVISYSLIGCTSILLLKLFDCVYGFYCFY